MATKKMKINFKMPTPTAAERLHAQQQKNRKAAGLPDPSEYKKKLDSMKSENYEEDDGSLSQEQLDEISAQLKASYVSGAKKQIKQSMPFTKKTDEYRDIAKNFIAKRQKGIAKATKVEEQLEKKGRFVSGPIKQPFKSNTIVTSVKEGVTIGGMVGRGNIHNYDRNPPAKDGSELENVPFHAKTEKQKKLQNALNDLGKKMKETHPKLKEDYDDPITITKKGTNIKKKISADMYNVFKHHGFRKEDKDSHEYDYEGDMAKSDLRSIIFNAKQLHEMLNPDTNLPEWCQSKITLAEDYLSTVTNYMRSEMNEEVVNEDKNDYQRKIEKNNKKFVAATKRQKNPLSNVPIAKGIEKSMQQKSVKESVQEPTEGEMKGKQQGVSRKAQIVMSAAKGKKSDNPDKFQKDPELSSEIHKT
jgi:hypothetical protein